MREDGSQCDFASYEGMASADGRYVFFTSSEPNLAPDYPDSWGGFYMVDTTTGDVTYLYTDSTSNRPARISADGRWVTYYSYTEETEGSHLNGVADVFVIGPLH